MKELLLKQIYPQRVFGRTLAAYIRQHIPGTPLIVDCPCGHGETTYHLAHAGSKEVIGVDISEEAIGHAQRLYASAQIRFIRQDIAAFINSLDAPCTFCLINSLFLFEKADELLLRLREKLSINQGKLLLIVPNTKGKNFSWFQGMHPQENKLILHREEFDVYFKQRGFKIDHLQPLCYAHHFNRKDVKLFSRFWGVYLGLVNTLQTWFKIGKPNYFFIALST